jgi:hypothetical protein
LFLPILHQRGFCQMLRCARLLVILLSLSGCATVQNGPSLSPANAKRIADAEVLRTMKIDPRRYESSGPRYIAEGNYWSVTYRLKANRSAAFTIRVSDKMQKASITEDDSGIFEGDLTEKNDFH